MLKKVLSNSFKYSLQRTLSHVPIEDGIFGLTDEEIELRGTFRKFFETELQSSNNISFRSCDEKNTDSE